MNNENSWHFVSHGTSYQRSLVSASGHQTITKNDAARYLSQGHFVVMVMFCLPLFVHPLIPNASPTLSDPVCVAVQCEAAGELVAAKDGTQLYASILLSPTSATAKSVHLIPEALY